MAPRRREMCARVRCVDNVRRGHLGWLELNKTKRLERKGCLSAGVAGRYVMNVGMRSVEREKKGR